MQEENMFTFMYKTIHVSAWILCDQLYTYTRTRIHTKSNRDDREEPYMIYIYIWTNTTSTLLFTGAPSGLSTVVYVLWKCYSVKPWSKPNDDGHTFSILCLENLQYLMNSLGDERRLYYKHKTAKKCGIERFCLQLKTIEICVVFIAR